MTEPWKPVNRIEGYLPMPAKEAGKRTPIAPKQRPSPILAVNCKNRRGKLGLTNKQILDRMHAAGSDIIMDRLTRIFSGYGPPSLDKSEVAGEMPALAEALECEPEDLFVDQSQARPSDGNEPQPTRKSRLTPRQREAVKMTLRALDGPAAAFLWDALTLACSQFYGQKVNEMREPKQS